jgi:hypothetical protein
MATTPTPAPKQSWLSKVGQFFSKVIKVVVTDAAPAEKIAVPVAEALLPEFAPLINTADGIFSGIVKECVNAETLQAVAGTATGSGPQKLAQVLAATGPLLDTWVSQNFPGAAQVSQAQKAGLINAVVAILNEISPTAVVPTATT